MASLDLFETEEFYENNFEFRKTEPLNDNFARYEMDSSTFLLCSGPFFLVLTTIYVWHLLKRIIYCLAYCFTFCFPKSIFCRKFGAYILDEEWWLSFKMTNTRVILEFYLDIGLAAAVCIRGMTRDHLNYGLFFDGGINILNSVLTYVFITIGTIFPFYYLVRTYYLKENQDQESYEGESAEELVCNINRR